MSELVGRVGALVEKLNSAELELEGVLARGDPDVASLGWSHKDIECIRSVRALLAEARQTGDTDKLLAALDEGWEVLRHQCAPVQALSSVEMDFAPAGRVSVHSVAPSIATSVVYYFQNFVLKQWAKRDK
jgi:hypothetical protein